MKKVIIVYCTFRMMSIFCMTKKSRKVLHSVDEFERELREEICCNTCERPPDSTWRTLNYPRSSYCAQRPVELAGGIFQNRGRTL